MKALVGAFNQEKALVGAFSVIVQPMLWAEVRASVRFSCLHQDCVIQHHDDQPDPRPAHTRSGETVCNHFYAFALFAMLDSAAAAVGQCTAGHEGAVADISCISIFSACFGLPTSVQLAATTWSGQIWISGWILPHFDVRTISVASKLKKLQIFLYY